MTDAMRADRSGGQYRELAAGPKAAIDAEIAEV